MYLKIKFNFYLIHGIELEEEITYRKTNEEVTDEDFERQVNQFEVEFRRELAEALSSKTDKILSYCDTMFNSSSLVAFKTTVIPVVDALPVDLENYENYENYEDNQSDDGDFENITVEVEKEQ